MTLLHQWTNTNVLQCKPVSTLIPCLEHRESAAPATKQQSKSRTCAATPSSQLGRANISALCKGQGAGAPGKISKHLLILQAFPMKTSLGPSHTPEDAKGFSGSALAQSNNPFWKCGNAWWGDSAFALLKKCILWQSCAIFSLQICTPAIPVAESLFQKPEGGRKCLCPSLHGTSLS